MSIASYLLSLKKTENMGSKTVPNRKYKLKDANIMQNLKSSSMDFTNDCYLMEILYNLVPD